ncbi:GTP 3',8-cyclase MoaA [Chitinophaga sp. SYP-B3965]|uniref:GTP 3',8-cyclase MoaA n=1 Tax=Chitinophaga sp. SYP-B3965 TaxID=2663120 RepID=UPI0012995D6A|nr:GTP 3',8-cyclase MoaA [Chitinophaga sp. SYP-B3965]MRG45862.1 GTP 3',8-cyclase MoaA [Chitinophaga sp. SYP-B3965]
MLKDNHQRTINYVRLAVTDRCNLRCTYCMPENMQFLERAALLSYEEIVRLMRTLTDAGINKIRITGGEPFLRKDLMQLLEQLAPMASISITTNGVLTAPFIPALKTLGIRQINLSLDTLQAPRFFQITRRDQFSAVKQTLESLLAHDMEVKLNMVVMDGVNTDELIDFVALTRDQPVSVRFIEEMPFNGQGNDFSGINWNYLRILDTIRAQYPIEKITDAPHSTSLNYQIPQHKGSIGVIPAYSRTFCGSCNRIRITPTGGLKTCLYGDDVLNVKSLLKEGASDAELLEHLQAALQKRAVDGFEAARSNTHAQLESMSVIGG